MDAKQGEGLWQQRFDGWAAACAAKHEGKYDYSLAKERVEQAGRWYVRIICPEHGEFTQGPAKHKMGRGCPVCAGNKVLDYKKTIRNLFPEVGVSDDLVIGNSKEKFTLTCPKHGDFVTTYNQLTQTKAKKGVGACPTCNKSKGGALGSERLFGKLAEATSADYIFCIPEDLRIAQKVTYRCRKHGVFSSKADDIAKGHICPKCGVERRSYGIHQSLGVTTEDHIVSIYSQHKGMVIPIIPTLDRVHSMSDMVCIDHGVFSSALYSIKAGHGCPKCSHRISKGEREVTKWLMEIGVEFETQSRNAVNTKYPVDIYVPHGAVAIEYCGLYWHGEDFKSKDFHLDRLEEAKKEGVRLLTVFEDEWRYQKEKVQGLILSVLGLDQDKVYARNTSIVDVTWAEASKFYNRYHLQGAGSPCPTNIALTFNGIPVAMASFKVGRYGGADYELMRFAHSTRVVGGLSKIVKAFSKGREGERLVSYCDLRWFTGESYSKAGFTHMGSSSPGYWWVKGRNRYSREKFQKHKLMELLEVYDENLSESENMRSNGFWKIYDCGMSRWEKTL